MSFKSVALIFMFFTFLVLSKVETRHSLNSPLDPMIDLAKQTLEFINESIDLVLEQSESTLKNLISHLDDLRLGALSLAKKQIQWESELLHKLIETIKSRFSDTSVEVLYCLEKVEINGGTLEEIAINNSMTCVDASIELSAKKFTDILEDLRRINVNFVEPEEKLEDCKGQLLPFECIQNIVTELKEMADNLPKTIKEDVDKAVFDFAALGYEVIRCGEDAIKFLQVESIQLFNDFADCVHETTTPSLF